MNNILKFVGQLNQAIGGATKLMSGYDSIKDKLTPQPKQVCSVSHPVISPAQRPSPPPQTIKQQEIIITMTEEQKLEKATALFNELHGMVKPFMLIAKGMNAGEVIMMALQPENKAMLIKKIAERL